jgi:hypothetical protein
MRSLSGLAPAVIIGVLATVAIVGGAVTLAILENGQSPNIETTPTPTPTVTPTVSPTATPTDPPASPRSPPTHTATPTTNPTASPSPSPSPSPTPEPVATAFQNATISYRYNEVNYTITWVVNGTLVDTNTEQGISGLTISVVDATNSSLIYGTTVTSEEGHFKYTFEIMQPPAVQLVFAGNDQYLAVTSSTIEMAPP